MKVFRFIAAALLLLAAFGTPLRGQFKSEAFSNGFGTADEVSPEDSVENLFSFKEFFAGMGHRQELKVGTLFAGSVMMIGSQQIYEQKYWKLPVIYGGLAATVVGGVLNRTVWDNRKVSNYCFAAAGLVYWGTLLDGVVNYPTDNPHHPGKAALYSVLCPGLGQAYNGEYWKIPVYWGCLIGSAHYLSLYQMNYKRYKRIYNEVSDPESGFTGSISAETAVYYRDIYRRYRDYSMLALAAFYLIQAVDANVFAFMQDFEVNDDLSMRISPTLITPDTAFALNTAAPSAVGLSLGIRF
jgi:hypothetical protein